jgi:hypothetical protein
MYESVSEPSRGWHAHIVKLESILITVPEDSPVHAAWARSSKTRKYPARGFFQTNRVNAHRGQERHFPPHTPNEVEFLATADTLARELESGASFEVEVIHDDRCFHILDSLCVFM